MPDTITMQPDQVLPLSFEDWKLRYRRRIADVAGIKPEAFAETLNMIADDETLRQGWLGGEDPEESADCEMSYWEE